MSNHRNTPRRPTSKPRKPTASSTETSSLRDQILADFATMRVPLSAEQLDEVLRTAELQGLSHLEFLQRLVGTQAQQRRERAVERRIREACFREVRLLEDFDWEFNACAIDRVQIEQLATGTSLVTNIDSAALRAQIPMSRVLDLLGFRPLRGRSPQLRGHCPLRNCPPVLPPRFSVNLQRHIYRCFACRSAGNQLDLWAAAQQLSLPAAAVHLCRVTATPVPRRQATSPSHEATRPATD